MKTKKLIAFVLLFISFRSNSQYFNNFIPNYNSNWDNTQTITKNAMNEIIFLSVNLNSTTYPRDFELVKLDRAGNYLLSKRVLDSFGTLRAISIIPTYDTGYIVTGSIKVHNLLVIQDITARCILLSMRNLTTISISYGLSYITAFLRMHLIQSMLQLNLPD